MKRIPFVTARHTYVLDAKIQVHGDRRTKRLRDRSTQRRKAIERSKGD